MADGAAYYRDTVIPGNSFQRQYVCKAGGVAVDLTGYTVRWTAYYGDQKIEKTTADGSLSVPSPSNGTVNLNLTPVETRKVPENDSMKYQLELVSGASVQTTVLYGDLVGQPGGYNLD
jgi:hypothetical protein